MKRFSKTILPSLFLLTTGTALVLGILAFPLLSSARSRNTVVSRTMPAVAMILSADIKNGKITPVSSGSGTIIHSNGSIITNHHVLYDAENKRLHDLFIVGLFRAADKEPEYICIGQPSKGVLKPDLDLALIRCDRDRSGSPWLPKSWPTIPVRQLETDDIVPGERVWVLGYPGVGGGTINISAGLISGWTNDDKGTGMRAFMKTDAAITHGNSGGTAVDDEGNFIGIPTAFRLTTTKQGSAVVTAGRIGLIRPLEHALDLVALANAGGPKAELPELAEKTPEAPEATEKNTQTPEAIALVSIQSKILDSNDGTPIEGAVVVVFKPGLKKADLSSDKLEEQALAWATTDAAGAFQITGIPVAQKYSVAVAAPGYLPLLEEDVLKVPAQSSAVLTPWKSITLAPK